jgi:hypothetical protein
MKEPRPLYVVVELILAGDKRNRAAGKPTPAPVVGLAAPQPDSDDGADSVERFAKRYGISRAQAYKELASKRLIGRKVGSRTIITHEDALAWARSLPKTSARKFNGPSPGVDVPASQPPPERFEAMAAIGMLPYLRSVCAPSESRRRGRSSPTTGVLKHYLPDLTTRTKARRCGRRRLNND